MSQFSPALNGNTNGASARLKYKKAFPNSASSDRLTTDAGKPVVGVMPESSAEKLAYRDDPFTFQDGRYVGHDGFVVPMDFEEFFERFPNYVRNWVRKHAERFSTTEDIEDWTQDLLVHLCHLSENSKHLKAGKKDIVQTFDPMKRGGANQARFCDYINLCLTNKFRTMRTKRMKDALSRPGRFSLDGSLLSDDARLVNDEFCCSHSTYLQSAMNAADGRARDGIFLQEFVNFVQGEDPDVLVAIAAIAATGTLGDAAERLGITNEQLRGRLNRLRLLGTCFVNGLPVPRRRGPYKKRIAKTKRLAASRFAA